MMKEWHERNQWSVEAELMRRRARAEWAGVHKFQTNMTAENQARIDRVHAMDAEARRLDRLAYMETPNH